MQDLQITWQTILAIFGGIAVIAGGAKVIMGMFSPYKALRAKVAEHDVKLANDHKRLQREEGATTALLSAILAMLDNAITGNSVEGLKSARKNLQTYLAERS